MFLFCTTHVRPGPHCRRVLLLLSLPLSYTHTPTPTAMLSSPRISPPLLCSLDVHPPLFRLNFRPAPEVTMYLFLWV